jgi:small conductance mechanosensitive channel
VVVLSSTAAVLAAKGESAMQEGEVTTLPDAGSGDAAPATALDLTQAEEAAGRILTGEITTADLMAIWNSVGWPVVKALILIIIVLLVARWARTLVVKATTKARVEITLARFFGNLARWAILVLGALTILQTIGVQITGFAAVLASVGFAIGLAMSGMVGNVAAGVMLLIFRPYKVGDFVTSGSVSGTVYEIELFTTTFDTPDNRRIIVPNNEIFGKVIENITYHPKRRVEVAVGTAYEADIDKTREALEAAASAVEGRTQEDEPAVFLAGLGSSSVDWKVRVWAPKADFWTVHQRLTRDVKVALDAAGISIPFPQMDVHMRQVTPASGGNGSAVGDSTLTRKPTVGG